MGRRWWDGAVDEPTEVTRLRSGPVEHRLVPGSGAGDVVVVMHGGHLRAGIPVAEEELRAAGFGVLVPSRPGYGRTPLSAGPGPARFADTTAELCAALGTTSVRAVVGVSAGGPAAIALAERHPRLVRSLVLVSARSALPFPTGATRLAARLAFGAGMEASAWAATAALLHRAPALGLRALLAGLSTLPVERVVADLGPQERRELVELFAAMRSGRGFAVDVRHELPPDLGRGVRQPALVVASRCDGQVGWEHVEHLRRSIPGARVWESPSLSHLVWCGSGGPATRQRVVDFVTSA